jgi:DNA repair protein RAD50
VKENEISSLKKGFEKKKEVFQKAQIDLEKKKRFIEQFEKLNSEKKEIKTQNIQETSKIEPLNEKLGELTNERAEKREASEKKENQLQSQIDDLQKELNLITNLSTEIKKYLSDNKEEQLNQTKEKTQKYKIKMEELNKMIETISKNLKESDEKINLQGTVKQNISDNKKYRMKKKELAQVEESISKLDKDYEKYTGTSKFDDKEIESIKKKRNKLTNEKSELIGMKTTHNDRIKKIKSELTKEEYADVEKKYKSTLIKLKTSEMANEDLDKYFNALNQSEII